MLGQRRKTARGNRATPALSRHHWPCKQRSREIRPKIVEEYEDDSGDPTIDGACHQAINETADSQQRKVREDRWEQVVALEIGKGYPQERAQNEDHLKEHARGEHGAHVR